MIRCRIPYLAVRRGLSVGLHAAIACCSGIAVQSATAQQVDFEKTNDYYAARGSSQLTVVETYHLGPCEQRFRERDWPRAVAECNYILRIFPNHPSALLIMAQVCEQYRSGLCLIDGRFQAATDINPKAPGTYVVQGIHLSRIKQYANAIPSFKTALELDPNQINAHYNLALAYLETSQFELANQHAQRAYELGAALPGLRNRLKQAGYWKPAAAAPGPEGQDRGQGNETATPSTSPFVGK